MTIDKAFSPARAPLRWDDEELLLLQRDEEALFHEARRLRRRRWALGALLAAAVLGAMAAVLVSLAASGGASAHGARQVDTAGVLPPGPRAVLKLAGPLAVAPTGALYVTNVTGSTRDPHADQVLMRLPDGRFRVVAGTGTMGFAGDGGEAVRAKLSAVSDLAVATNGTLYIADGGRVRAVSPDGIIRTIAGNGQPLESVIDGTPGRAASLGTSNSDPLRIALNPMTGRLYISDVRQIVRLTAAGTLDAVRANRAAAHGAEPLTNFASVAVDASGSVVVSGPQGWTIWRIPRSGLAQFVGFSRGSGGTFPVLQPGPGGAIYTESGGRIVRIQTDQLVALQGVDKPLSAFKVRPSQRFPTLYFAFSPKGTVYADDSPGGLGAETHQQLLAINHGHISVLWQERGDAKG